MHMAMVVICAVLTVPCENEFISVESKLSLFGLSTWFLNDAAKRASFHAQQFRLQQPNPWRRLGFALTLLELLVASVNF